MSKTVALDKPKNPLVPWIMAMRPKTFGLFSIPMIVGTLIVPAPLSTINWYLLASALLSAFFIQIGMHYINDAEDFKRGTDTKERLGPVKVTQKGWLSAKAVQIAGFICLELALVAAIPLIIHGNIYEGVAFLLLIITSQLLACFYTLGPKPISYLGIGEPLVLIFYGWAATMANFYLQTGYVDTLSFVAGTQVGLLCTIMLALGNLRDHIGDAKANKKTPAVRFGVTFARVEITVLAFIPFLLTLFWVDKGYSWTILSWLTLPLAVALTKRIWTVAPGAAYNKFFGLGVLLHISFSLLLAIGYRMSF